MLQYGVLVFLGSPCHTNSWLAAARASCGLTESETSVQSWVWTNEQKKRIKRIKKEANQKANQKHFCSQFVSKVLTPSTVFYHLRTAVLTQAMWRRRLFDSSLHVHVFYLDSMSRLDSSATLFCLNAATSLRASQGLWWTLQALYLWICLYLFDIPLWIRCRTWGAPFYSAKMVLGGATPSIKWGNAAKQGVHNVYKMAPP